MLTSYPAQGNTPLYDAIDMMHRHLVALPDVSDATVLIEVFSDGEENGSRQMTFNGIRELIRNIDAQPNWTITARTNARRQFEQIGIPSDNILVWDGQTEESLVNTVNTSLQARGSFMKSVATGAITKSTSYYTDLSKVQVEDVQKVAADISPGVKIYTTTGTEVIKPFIERMDGSFVKGTVFYQLTKTEDAVQDYKTVVVVNKKTGAAYGGRDARTILGFPHTGSIKVKPGNHGDWDVFIQSTSINRKLPGGTKVLVWDPAKPILSVAVKTPAAVKPVTKSTKATKAPVAASSDQDKAKTFYTMGYKDGKRRQKNMTTSLASSGHTDEARHYQEGFLDGKAKKASKY